MRRVFHRLRFLFLRRACHNVHYRERLDDRRESLGFTFEHDWQTYNASLSLYPDGRPGEIFIDHRDPGSTMAALLRDGAVLTSIALQYGAPLETLRAAVTRLENGQAPASPIGAALDALNEEIRGYKEAEAALGGDADA